MLNRLGQETGFPASGGVTPDGTSEDLVDLDRLWSAFRRQFWVIVGSVLVALALGAAYLITAVPQYSAVADILIDNRRVNAVAQNYALTDQETTDGVIGSELKVIQSERVAKRVVDKLDLANDPAFLAKSSGLVSGLISAARNVLPGFGGGKNTTQSTEDAKAREEAATQLLLNRMGARRAGQTYVLEVKFTDPDPNLAAMIATTIAQEYLNDQMETSYDASLRASEWLKQRIAELQQQSVAADQAVQKFKTEHGLVDVGNTSVADQQLAGLNAQLIAARATTSDKLARLQRIQSIIKAHNMDAVVSEALDNPVITNLRTKYLDTSKRYQELSKLLGPDHMQVKALSNELQEYTRLIFDEMQRIAQGYESDYEIAKAQQAALQKQFEDQMAASEASSSLKGQLGELERQADTLRDLHQSYLTRYQDVLQQKSFPVTQARILNFAQVPTSPSSPKRTLILVLAGMLGLAIGVVVGAFFEYRDRFFRTSEQVRDELQLDFLGNLPQFDPRREKGRSAAPAADLDEAAQRSKWPSERLILKTVPGLRYVMDHSLSNYSETLRAAKLAVDRTLTDQALKIIGIASVLPGEGKSTVAKNFASLLSDQGGRVLLIDGDLRHPALSTQLANVRAPGLVQAVTHKTPIEDLLYFEPETGLFFLPANADHRSSASADFLASGEMNGFLKRLTGRFDYVVFDLPPIGPLIDARAAAANIDEFLLVVEWGRTARRLTRATLGHNPEIYDKCVGVVYNKANLKKMKMYALHGHVEQYYAEYAKYYRS